MILVFKFCKEARGKVEAKCLFRLLSGSSCFKSAQASNPHPSTPPLSPTQEEDTPRFRCLYSYPGAVCRVLCAHTCLSPSRSIDWTGSCFGGKQEVNGVIVREVRPVDSILTILGSSSFFLIPESSNLLQRKLQGVWSLIQDRDSGLFLGPV